MWQHNTDKSMTDITDGKIINKVNTVGVYT